jgi:hypothetical protein
MLLSTPSVSTLTVLPLDSTKSLPCTESSNRTLSSVKADDAIIPIFLWNDTIYPNAPPHITHALDILHDWRLCLWRKHLVREFLQWFHHTHDVTNLHHRSLLSAAARIDLTAGRDCLQRCMGSSWWEWSAGSCPLFWRWPHHYRERIRDGIPLWFKGIIPKWRRPQPSITDPQLWSNMRTKLQGVRSKGYIIKGDVFSLTSFFAVPKGDSDIRMVYDGTKSGLNGMLWAPWFPLPTIDAHLRALLPGYFMSDIDIGEMFLNFMLHESVQKYCGVDLTQLFPEEVLPGQVLWERWGRRGMGFVFFPYQSVQGILWAEEVIMGDRLDATDPFRFALVILNLPGTPTYNPSLPWVFKQQSLDGPLASDLFSMWMIVEWLHLHIMIVGVLPNAWLAP